MVIGVVEWELAVPGCRSLKEKRMALRSLKDRLRNRFNLSVAETDLHEVHDRARLTIVTVAGDRKRVDSVLDRADTFVETDARVVIRGTDRWLT